MTAVDRSDNGQDEGRGIRVDAARLLIKMLARDREPIGEDLWTVAGGSALSSRRAGVGEQNAARDFLDGLRRHSTNPVLLRAVAEVEATLEPDPAPQCPSTSHGTDGGWRCEHRAGHDLKVKHKNGEVEW